MKTQENSRPFSMFSDCKYLFGFKRLLRITLNTSKTKQVQFNNIQNLHITTTTTKHTATISNHMYTTINNLNNFQQKRKTIHTSTIHQYLQKQKKTRNNIVSTTKSLRTYLIMKLAKRPCLGNIEILNYCHQVNPKLT